MLFEQNSVYETLAQNKTSTLTNKEIRLENTLQTIVNVYLSKIDRYFRSQMKGMSIKLNVD